MGGIAVALAGTGGSPAAAVRRMLASAPHRGSDTTVFTQGSCALGIGNASDRPDANLEAAEGLAAAFVGSLDNAAHVGKLLERRGVHPPSMTPAGLLIGAFREFGEEAPALLRGAFAAALTDGGRVWFLRDQVGFETLFWRQDAGGVYVASEAKQVVAGAQIPWEPDLEVLEQIFYSNVEDHSLCALKGVRRVICGNLLLADAERVRRRRYWHAERLLETARLSPDEIAERFDELMDQAAARTLTGEDAVALSGGIDSPAVAAYAAPAHIRMTGRPIAALSAVYPDFPTSDERIYIEEVARFLEMPLHTYEPEPQRLDRLQEWVRLFDGPWSTWSPLGAEEQLRIACALGIRTILTGEMAEQVMAMDLGLVAFLLSKGRVGAALRFLGLKRRRGRRWRRLGREVAWTFLPRWAMAAHVRRNPLLAMPDWLDARKASVGRARHALPGRRYWPISQLAAFGDGSSLTLEASSIIQARDRVRIRQPWADVDLWEFFLSLPAEVKFPEPQVKALVRKLLRGKVPDMIVDRQDKPVLNEWFEATSLDYESLRRWLHSPKHRVLGIDYDRLAQHLEREDMDLAGYIWAKDLAAMQSFLSLW